MILGFVVVLSIVGISLALAMYAHLLPFIGTMGDVKEYNTAYYGAQTALERSLLTLRYREAGFAGVGGVTALGLTGPASDDFSGFGRFDQKGNTLYRRIEGRGNTIPGTGMGNVESHLLSGISSNDYNILTYNQSQHIPLRYDALSPGDAYRSDIRSIRSVSGAIGLRMYFTLNNTIKDLFLTQAIDAAMLDVDSDYDGDTTSDDIAVDRGRRGIYKNNDTLQTGSFTILPRSVVSYNSGSIGTVVYDDDETLRESVINSVSSNNPAFVISPSLNQGGFNPLSTVYTPSTTSHRMITDSPYLSGMSFIDLLRGGTADMSIFEQMLSFSLFSPLMTPIATLYPFIQYKVVCDGCDDVVGSGSQIAQPYFFIYGESSVGDYTVTMQMKKSIDDASVVSQFTVIF